jgi:hypothetical protein
MMEGLSADSEEKHEPASDIDTALMDSLKVLDPERPIREADMRRLHRHVGLSQIRKPRFQELPKEKPPEGGSPIQT